jgi:DNA-binding response OmpR family regulator
MTKILIVEDDPSILVGLKDLMRLVNYDVLTSQDGQECIELIMTESPDLVLLDVNLPVENGFEVCRRIREKNYIKPVIMLTWGSDDLDKELGFELGVSDFVIKPFNIHELLARIQNQLDKRKDYPVKRNVGYNNSERKLMM